MKTFLTLLFIMATVIYVSALDPSLNRDTSVSNNVLSMQQKQNSLIKRQSRRYIKRSKKDCLMEDCELELKPCPDDCPYSCGYRDSPDPCCPLLGKPTCPDL